MSQQSKVEQYAKEHRSLTKSLLTPVFILFEKSCDELVCVPKILRDADLANQLLHMNSKIG